MIHMNTSYGVKKVTPTRKKADIVYSINWEIKRLRSECARQFWKARGEVPFSSIWMVYNRNYDEALSALWVLERIAK